MANSGPKSCIAGVGSGLNSAQQGGSRAYSLRNVLEGGSWLVGTRVLSLIGNFALLALIPRMLGPERYGVWAVITSSTGLLTCFTLGLGPAVRNELAVLKHGSAQEQEQDVFFSSQWFLFMIVVVIGFLGFLSQQFVDYGRLFTITDASLAQRAGSYFFLATIFYLLSLPFTQIGHVTYAYHRFKFVATYEVTTTVIPPLIGIGVAYFFENKLLVLVFVTFAMKFIINLALTGVFFIMQGWRIVMPGLKTIWINVTKLVFSAFQFWLLNLSYLVLFTTDTLIVNKIVNVSIAGEYNLVLKIYFMIVTLYSTFMSPLWNFYTDAATVSDWVWIRRSVKKTWIMSVGGIAALAFALAFLVRPLISVWSGVRLSFGLEVVFALALWAVVFVWVKCFGMFLNGLNAMGYQTIAMVCGAIVNIPLTIFLVKVWGVMGAPLATVISLIPLILVGPIHSFILVRRNCADAEVSVYP